MKLIAGLGNPGARYESTRHNIGFMAVDAIAHRHNFSSPQERFQGIVQEGTIAGKKLWLLKPKTFMNLSGNAVGEIARFYKIAPEEIFVLHDELDLPLGKLRVKQGGGHGGHNGLKSIDSHIGQNYQRCRMGVAHPGDKHDVSDYVLSSFTKAEMPIVQGLLDAVAQHIELMVKGDPSGFQNKIALAMRPLLPENTVEKAKPSTKPEE